MSRVRIVPAIDLIGGRCVRLRRGEFSTSEVVGEDPLAVAKQFAMQGFGRLHVVDLDGARSGTPQHLECVAQIAHDTGMAIDYSGGLRSAESIQRAFDSGARYVVIGSAAVLQREMVLSWMNSFGSDRFILGFDVLDGTVRVKGWQESSNLSLEAVVAQYRELPVYGVMSTDISKDGMLAGPAGEVCGELRGGGSGRRVVASGGGASALDVQALAGVGVSEIIIGKALYARSLSLSAVQEFIW